MKLQFKTLILLLMLPGLVLANHDKFNGKYTKEKTVKKEFTVNKDARLKVDNSYGNVDITTWTENRTVIEVRIRTNGNNEEKVQKKLEEITVEFTADSGLVSAKTIFNKNKSSWKFWNDVDNNVSMEINYTIKIPITNSVDLDNDYGAISINSLKGNAKINCDYGQLHIGELLADGNYLNFDYTSKSTIGFMKSGKINADYSGFTLEKAERLELVADYTQSEILEVEELNYNCDYGKISVDNAGNVMGRGDYLTNRFGKVNGSLNLNTDYGSIKVEELTSAAKNVTIDGDYTGISLGISSGYSFNFKLDLSYARLKGEDHVTITTSDEDGSDKIYTGYHGNKNSGNSVNIKSDYGGVSFFKN